MRSRNALLTPRGAGVPPLAVLLERETHRLLRRDNGAEWEAVLNKIQTVEGLADLRAAEPGQGPLVGELHGMCTVAEMVDKQLTSTTNDLERLANRDDVDGRYINYFLAVKSFQRSDASKTFSRENTRSVVWCRRTIDMCLRLHGDADDRPPPRWLYNERQYRFADIYNFWRDRFRGLWQDLTIQHAPTHQGTIEVLEISCRLLILADQLLSDDPDFTTVQNDNLLSTCLDKLMESYEAVRKVEQPVRVDPALRDRLARIGADPDTLRSIIVYQSPFEDEFWAYRLLLCLSSKSSFDAALHVSFKIPPDLRGSPTVQLAHDAFKALATGNEARYFRLLAVAPPLVSFLLAKYSSVAGANLLAKLACDNVRKQNCKIPKDDFKRLFRLEPSSDDRLVDELCQEVNANVKPTFVDVSTAAVTGNLSQNCVKHCFLEAVLAATPVERSRLLDPKERLTELPPATSGVASPRLPEITVETPKAPEVATPGGLFAAQPLEELPIATFSAVPLAKPDESVFKVTSKGPEGPWTAFTGESAQPSVQSQGDSKDDASAISCDMPLSEGPISRKRASAAMVSKLPGPKKQKADRDEVESSLKAYGVEMLEAFNDCGTEDHGQTLAVFNAAPAVEDMKALVGTGIEPALVIHTICVIGSQQTPLAAVLETFLMGTARHAGYLPTWADERVHDSNSLADAGCVISSSLWLKKGGRMRSAVGLRYVSMIAPSENFGSCLTTLEAPAWVMCCSAELHVSRSNLSRKTPWRVDNAVALSAELGAICGAVQRYGATAVTLVWAVKLKDVEPTEVTKATVEALRECVSHAVQKCVQAADWLRPLQGVIQGSEVLIVRFHRRREVQLVQTAVAGALRGVAKQAPRSALKTYWQAFSTNATPYVLLNIWKRELLRQPVAGLSVSGLVELLNVGLAHFLSLPFWKRAEELPADLLLALPATFVFTRPGEVEKVRKVFKRLKKTVEGYMESCSELQKQRDEDAALFEIGCTPEDQSLQTRVQQARKLLREVIKKAVLICEGQLGVNLMRRTYLLPLPLQQYAAAPSLEPAMVSMLLDGRKLLYHSSASSSPAEASCR